MKIRLLLMLCAITSCTNFREELNVDWTALNSKQYTVRYYQHNFNNFPTDSTAHLRVVDFADSPDLMTLDSTDVASLVHLISDSTNFSDGDCGTFALNAGFIVFNNDETINGIIEVGCGFNQWEFEPFNPNCKWGGLNEKGFRLMSDMLDEINIKK
jgi:hypothetical protein